MCTSHSSVSYWSQMKVTLLVKSSLVLVFAMFLGLETQAIHTSPVQVQRDFKKLARCNFFVSEKNNSVRDILECMNELASQQIADKKNSRVAEKRSGFFSETRDIDSNKPYEYNPYPTYPEIQNNFYNKPNILKRGPQQSGHRPNHYGYPPALPPSYPMPSNADFRPGILGVNLLDALSSISQYDDRKCVPRILCEVATGVKPGSSGYKQNYSDFGMNSIISLLTALAPGTSSPLIAFGKSALMGYANKGNPDICYRQYPHCPRNPSDLVDYLNNHNGGFFRFFNNRYGANRDYDNNNGDNINDDDDDYEPQNGNPYSDDYSAREINNSEADETLLIKTINNNEDNNKKITFPEEEKSNRASIYSENHNTPSFFPQNRTSQEYKIKNNNEKQLLKLPETKIYHSDNLTSQKPASNTFPTRQKVMMNSEFTKLVLDDDKASKKDALTHIKLKSINFQQFEMINMAKLYLDNETTKSKIQQPCNMICNDSNNNTVQFKQYITTSGLTTKKISNGSILNLSNQLVCQVICQNISYDDERQLSTPLHIVLQPNKYDESILQQMILDKNSIIINEKIDNIKRILMTESLVPHSGVSLVDLAGEHEILQQPKYIEPRPPVLIDEQGASRLMPLGVLLFRQKVFTDASPSTVHKKEEKKFKKTPSLLDIIKNLSVITTTLDKDIFLNYNMKGKTTTRVREKKNSIDMTQINRSPEGEDYPQGSCLENESKGLNDDDEDNINKNKDNSKVTTKIPLNKKPNSKNNVRKNDNVQQFMIQIPQANIKFKAVNIC
ncbi:hypothetical protein HCN44_010062 [Aphidius gifuensis]|uniref:Uncharacterized protein n=1 Tax=Aphidius gifuensis TaxID=684658 RepID=A0A835CRM3_APHGI|nr:probable serine/threonine-protein kinase DDB_G0283337 [Aphidius gifuensis]KAF7993467.1 hypothetical protein HCN44_010062 [Aphidius gifuensis]